MLYDVFYYAPNGIRLASFDSDVSSSYPVEDVCKRDRVYAKCVNKDWDGHVVWYGPHGGEIARPPWEPAPQRKPCADSEPQHYPPLNWR